MGFAADDYEKWLTLCVESIDGGSAGMPGRAFGTPKAVRKGDST